MTVHFLKKDSNNGKQLIDLDNIVYKKTCAVDCNFSFVQSNDNQLNLIDNLPVKHRKNNDRHIVSNIGTMRVFSRIFLE